MAKKKRESVGSVYRSKEEGKPPYIKMRDGQIYSLESAKFQRESLDKAVNAGKLSPEIAETIHARIDKIPEYVLFEIVKLVDKE